MKGMTEKCELCGMQAVGSVTDHLGVTHFYCHYHMPKEQADKHVGHEPNFFKKRFWISLLLTLPVLYFSEFFQKLLGFEVSAALPAEWLLLIFGSIVFFYGGPVFIKSAKAELKNRQPGMMTLITLAIISAYLYSIAAVLILKRGEFFWELSTLITVMLLGHWLEMAAVSGAQKALKELEKLLPDQAEIILPEGIKAVSARELKEGDIVLIRPGARVPADGMVSEGESSIDESMLTGESKAVFKTIGQKVIAGTVNQDGSLKVKVTGVGEKMALSGIMRLVAEAQKSKSKMQTLADRSAYYLTIIAIITGSITLFFWFLIRNDFGFALERLVSVLVIACPHALGLAVPLVVSISTSLGVRGGLLVKKRQALESARLIDMVLFDKTGTLTSGEPSVSDYFAEIGRKPEDVIALAAEAELHSEHKLGKAVVRFAKEKNLEIKEAKSFKSWPGRGVEVIYDNKKIAVGGREFLSIKKSAAGDALSKNIKKAESEGKTVVYVFVDDRIVGALALTDTIRQESFDAIKILKKEGIKVAMITGDSEPAAKYVASKLGLDEYFSQVLPEDKEEKVRMLKEKGYKVAMVGDGVNDAPALVVSDLGIAVGAGTDVAVESADIVLVRSNPLDIPKIIRLSGATYKKMIQNLIWATAYNIVAIPLAAGVLAGKDFFLTPALAAFFMSMSTVIVAFNAQFLRYLRL